MTKMNYHHGDLRNSLIKAGAEILLKEGVASLTLRRVARQAGVSHSAPYAHFTDKQSLIAAISTQGFENLLDILYSVVNLNQSDPAQMLLEFAYAYSEFAIANPAHFKLMFSGILEDEHEYKDFENLSMRGFDLLLDVVRICQDAGVLKKMDTEIQALNLWSLVHGHAALFLESQFSHITLERVSLRKILHHALQQFTITHLPMID
jgi:AcrR family transcriptional regulator